MNDEDFMKLAIEEAKKGYRPFGAIVVKDNKIIVRTHNTATSDPTAHAETNAIREACNILKTRDLSGCTLYASCEPCAMCFTAALWARISKIVFGAYAKDVPEDG
ncbi:nucleoside deaminase, partial [Candidatus Woesearchaeota archaeon]|nr:nucleoside deaminase [Candidatus Woesearchaeota archaeon]